MSEETEATTKRQRQKQRQKQRKEEQQRKAKQARRKSLLRTAAVLVVGLALVGGIAWLLAGDADTDLDVADPQIEDGTPLPALDTEALGTDDAAFGMAAPTASGATPDGDTVRIGAGSGTPQALAFNAHWCPHCQAELPEVAGWVADGALADGVELVGISTRHDPARPNWPPDEWFEREAWPGTVLLDTTDAVADAYGLTTTPFWVFVDDDGSVVARAGGRIDQQAFATLTEVAAGG